MLDQAKAYRKRVTDFDLAAAGIGTDDWMAIVGVGDETRVRLRVRSANGKPFFDLRSMDRVNGYPKPEQGVALSDTGDGTVPYWAAVPPFLDRKHLIAVSDDDFGYWEFGDRALERFAAGLHGMLPEMSRVAKLAVAFLDADAGKKGKAHPGIKGRRAPDVDAGDWDPPIKGLEEKQP